MDSRPVVEHGRGGDDRLVGGGADDVLDGGPGTDLADGRAGVDRCLSIEGPLPQQQETRCERR